MWLAWTLFNCLFSFDQMGKLKEAGPVRSGVEYALQKAFRTTDSQDVVDPAVEYVCSRSLRMRLAC